MPPKFARCRIDEKRKEGESPRPADAIVGPCRGSPPVSSPPGVDSSPRHSLPSSWERKRHLEWSRPGRNPWVVGGIRHFGGSGVGDAGPQGPRRGAGSGRPPAAPGCGGGVSGRDSAKLARMASSDAPALVEAVAGGGSQLGPCPRLSAPAPPSRHSSGGTRLSAPPQATRTMAISARCLIRRRSSTCRLRLTLLEKGRGSDRVLPPQLATMPFLFRRSRGKGPQRPTGPSNSSVPDGTRPGGNRGVRRINGWIRHGLHLMNLPLSTHGGPRRALPCRVPGRRTEGGQRPPPPGTPPCGPCAARFRSS
jgi:hypothetical protein